MADPKYANLPGIAYDQPDFYETSDLPESDQYTDYTEAEEENISIEKVHLNPEVASERFRGKYLDGSKVDFSDRITKPRRQRGYDAQTLWELAPSGEPETTLQKYLRLKCEFQELINEIQANGVGTDDPNLNSDEIIKEAVGMQKQLLDLRMDKSASSSTGAPAQLKNKIAAKLDEIKPNEAKGKGTKSDSDSGIQYELCVQPSGMANSQVNRVTELEQRLQRLETVMGTDRKDKLANVALSLKNQSILGSLNVLNTKLSLLEPSHLELLEARLASVLQKVTKISEKKLDVQELERTLKLSDLYDLMEESSGTIQALPELTTRLNSLRELHQNAAEIVKELADVKSLQEAIANGTIENDRLLKDLQGVVSETLNKQSK